MDIQVLPLGAGQDVGRSCVVVWMAGVCIMFDCGVHMGFVDDRRYPDFSMLAARGGGVASIDAVVITHFHLDHCGALPLLTEKHGYRGKVYMTHPTRALMTTMLWDYRQVMAARKGERAAYDDIDINRCLSKVVPVALHETVEIGSGVKLTAYYAGHVLGAAMFRVECGGQSVVYTGDYNMTPDRHLGAASIVRVRPDLLITESTYATTVRLSKLARETEFFTKVHETVQRGGKVLIPVFAMGRAQELALLIHDLWDRMQLNVPIYFTRGMASAANTYYRLLVTWTNEKIKGDFIAHNPFYFSKVQDWEPSYLNNPGPCVLFATSGMLHSGTSLDVFKHWAPDAKNLVVIPGYCVAGTIGHKLMSGKKDIKIHDQPITVRCATVSLPFSAHADAKGILQLISQCAPSNVMLVHGEKEKMDFFRSKVTRTFGLACYSPANGSIISMRSSNAVPIRLSAALVREQVANARLSYGNQQAVPVHGVLIAQHGAAGLTDVRLMGDDEALSELSTEACRIGFASRVTAPCQHGDGNTPASRNVQHQRNALVQLAVRRAAAGLHMPQHDIASGIDYFTIRSFHARLQEVCNKPNAAYALQVACACL